MDRYFLKYVPVVLLSALAVTVSACSDSDPATPTAPAALQATGITAEQLVVDPEFLPSSFCLARPPFRATVVIIVGGGHDVILRGLRFNFLDRLGGRVSPIVFPAQTGTGTITSIPTSGPIPTPGVVSIPGASPIPIPGSSSINGLLVSAHSFRRLPFVAEFGCGTPAAGTLVITVETADRRGAADTSEIRVAVGG